MANTRRANLQEPTAIQRYAIPCIQQNDDLMACAQTGAGKTVSDNERSIRFSSSNFLGCVSLTNHFKFIEITWR